MAEDTGNPKPLSPEEQLRRLERMTEKEMEQTGLPEELPLPDSQQQMSQEEQLRRLDAMTEKDMDAAGLPEELPVPEPQQGVDVSEEDMQAAGRGTQLEVMREMLQRLEDFHEDVMGVLRGD